MSHTAIDEAIGLIKVLEGNATRGERNDEARYLHTLIDRLSKTQTELEASRMSNGRTVQENVNVYQQLAASQERERAYREVLETVHIEFSYNEYDPDHVDLVKRIVAAALAASTPAEPGNASGRTEEGG